MADRSTEHALDPIVGRELTAVVFIHDYVQLHFGDSGLTAITLPVVSTGDVSLKYGEPCYRDVLCERIGKVVKKALVEEGHQVRIEFEDGSIISISLLPEDYLTAEAVVFDNGPQETWVW